jgi:hypothetical protein
VAVAAAQATGPVITNFQALPAGITAGGSTQLVATFSGGTGSIDNGVGAVTSGTAVKITPSVTTTYTLTVDNGAGGKVTAQAQVLVGGVGGTAISLFQTSPAVVGQPTSFKVTVTPQGSIGKAGIAQSPFQTFADTEPLDVNGSTTLTVTFVTPGPQQVSVYCIDSAGNIGGSDGSVKNSVSVTVTP